MDEDQKDDDNIGQFYGTFSDLPAVEVPPAYVGKWLRRGTYTTIFARAGMGKTILVQELVHCLRGEAGDFFGQEVSPIGDEPGDILWVNGDLRMWQVQERLNSFRGRDGSPDLVVFWQALQTCLLECLETLLERAATAKVVIFDHRGTLFRINDANTAENWTLMNDALIALCEAGVAVIMLTHESKTNAGGAFGSSAQEWPVDTMIRVGQRKAMKGDEERVLDTGHAAPPLILSWTKARLCATPEPMPFRIDLDLRARRLRPVWKDYQGWN